MLRDVKGSVRQRQRGDKPAAENWIEDPTTGCWIYQGPREARLGYGPYKWIYEQLNGKVAAGYDLHHSCRRGPEGCVNPAHLELMTSARHRRMHAHERAILTVEQAQEIRRRLVETLEPTYKIAEDYGVTRFIIERIGAGTYWPDAGGTPLVYARTCPFCGVDFATTSRRQRYCTKDHQKAYNNSLLCKTYRKRFRRFADA